MLPNRQIRDVFFLDGNMSRYPTNSGRAQVRDVVSLTAESRAAYAAGRGNASSSSRNNVRSSPRGPAFPEFGTGLVRGGDISGDMGLLEGLGRAGMMPASAVRRGHFSVRLTVLMFGESAAPPANLPLPPPTTRATTRRGSLVAGGAGFGVARNRTASSSAAATDGAGGGGGSGSGSGSGSSSTRIVQSSVDVSMTRVEDLSGDNNNNSGWWGGGGVGCFEISEVRFCAAGGTF
jgi:hypothetical protein